jgi:putative ABC transport system permease protein
VRALERLVHRLRALFGRRRADASLASEIALHLEEATREHLARGLSPAEARLAARREFGSVAFVEDQCRDTRRVGWLHGFAQDVRHGLRALVAQPLVLAAATASIGAGAGAPALVVNLTSELLLARPSVRDADALVNITLDGNSHVSYADWRALDEAGALAGLAGYHIEGSVNLRQGERSEAIVPLLATANFFDVLGVPVAMGRGFTAAEAAAGLEPRVAVISDRFWRVRLGADPRAVGRAIIVNGEPYTVLGVLPPKLKAIAGFGLAPEVYLPLSRTLVPGLDHPHAAAAQLVGRLKPGETLEAARAALDTVVQRRHQENRERPRHVGQFSPVTEGQSGLGSIWRFFLVLVVVGLLVLGIACANVAGLLLARSTVRQKEIAVRATLGASRARIAQQLLVEALWLAALGTLGGLAFMVLAMAAIASLPLPLPLPMELGVPLDWRLLAVTLSMVIAATLLSGVLPALSGSRAALSPALKQAERAYVHRRVTLRGLLVIGQVTLSAALLVTALLFVRNLSLARSSDPGFDTTKTLVAQLGLVETRYTADTRIALLEGAVERVEALPGVERATFAFGMPLSIRHGRTSGAGIAIAGEPGARPFQAMWAENFVGTGYFDTLRIPLRHGRDFAASDRAGAQPVVVANETFVQRYLGGRAPVGLHLMLPGPGHDVEHEIVGVVADSRHRSIGEKPMAALYFAYRQRPGDCRVLHVMARVAGDPEAAVRPMAAAIGELDPSAAVDVQTVSRSLAFAFLPSRVGAALLGGLGAIGLILAMAGLFAMVSYSVTRRTREIGVRMALGAPSSTIVRLVAADAAALVAAGLIIGLALAALVAQPLALFLVDGLSPHDPLAFGGTAILFAAVAAIATLPPIRRALGAGPLTALRTE